MEDLISMGLAELFQAQPNVAECLPSLQRDVREGRITPLAASRELLELFHPPASPPPKE
jgi:hypothetical protein